MKEKMYDMLKLMISILSFFIVGDIINLILKLFGITLEESNALGMVVYQLIASTIIFIVLFILYFKAIKKDYKTFKNCLKKNILLIIKTFIIFMIVKYAVSFITAIIMVILKLDMESINSINQKLIETYIKSSPTLMFISTALLAPVYEELLFRLGIKKVVGRNRWFIIISGTIFGLLHVFPLEEGVSLTLGLVQSISYVTMGLFLAYIYKKTNNIFISIGIHFLNNFLSILTMINMF